MTGSSRSSTSLSSQSTTYLLLTTFSERGHLLVFSCSSSGNDSLPLNLGPQTIARITCPKAALCGRLLEFDIDSVKFLSWPVTVDGSSDVDGIAKFNVVAAMPLHCVRRHEVARLMVSQLAAALTHEQRRRNFVSSQVSILLRARDNGGDIVSQMKRSSLACALYDLCTGLHSDTFRNIRINDWIYVSSCQPPDDGCLASIRPYRTVLLLEDADNIIAELPDDASSSLRRLIRIANPMKSFRDMSVDLGMPMSHIFRLAAHLVHWGKARILNTLTKHSILTINPDVIITGDVCDTFEATFPTRGLSDQLSRFAVPKRLEEHLRILGALDSRLCFSNML